MGQAGPASDLYALGATFLHLVTGRPPGDFVGADGKIAVPDDLPGGEPLRSLIARLVAANPADRYPSARAVRDALLSTTVAPTPGNAIARRAPSTAALALDDPAARERLRKQLSGSAARLMFPTIRPSEPMPAAYYAGWIIMCLLSGGTVFLIAYGQYVLRARRLARFFRDGLPATARLLSRDHHGNCTYEFTVDGLIHRGADAVPTAVSLRLDTGDAIQILYLPTGGFDSVIIETA
jgi:hypothetical protein